MCESYQEVSNEYEYNLGYVDKDNYFIPDIFFMPRVHDDLVLDMDKWQKERYI